MKYSKNQAAAKQFLRWVSSKEIFDKWFVSQQGYTAGPTKVWENHHMWSVDPVLAHQVFGRLLLRGDLSQVGVMDLNVRQWFEFYPNIAGAPLWEQLARDAAENSGGSKEDVAAQIVAAPEDKRAGLLETFLGREVARVLRMDPSRIDRLEAFSTMGLDSLMSIELRNRLEASLGLRLSATLLFTYPNLATLSQHLAGKLVDSAGGSAASAPPAGKQPGAAAEMPASPSLEDAALAAMSADELLKEFDNTVDQSLRRLARR